MDAAGSNWHYDYDGAGNITNITDALGGHYVMVYSNRNERILERNQDTNKWTLHLRRAGPASRPRPSPMARCARSNTMPAAASPTVTFNTGRINSFLYDDNDNPVVLSRTGSGPAHQQPT